MIWFRRVCKGKKKEEVKRKTAEELVKKEQRKKAQLAALAAELGVQIVPADTSGKAKT